MTGRTHDRPVVYGEPEQVVLLLDALTRIVDHQPAEVLADPGVNDALQQLGAAVAEWCQADSDDPAVDRGES